MFCPAIAGLLSHQSISPFDAHCKSSSDHFDKAALTGCVPLALSLLTEPDAAAEGSWNRTHNLGLDRSTRASMARCSRLAPHTMVISGLSLSSPSSKAMFPYSSCMVAEVVGMSEMLLVALLVGAGLSKSWSDGGGSTIVVGWD